jgi:hypothetical protein
MNKETPPLQQDMFTGEWIDNRSSYRKRVDRESSQPKQLEIFAAREVVQIGVQLRPWLNQLPDYKLELESEDPRTPEEIERDLLRQAQEQTVPMFAGEPVTGAEPDGAAHSPRSPAIAVRGFRARARAASVPVRRRASAPIEAHQPV